MSNYAIIAETSKILRQILWESFAVDPVIRAIVNTEQTIVFTNPTETARDSSNRLSLWLYQITENEFMKNQPMMRTAEDTERRFPPLALNFYYLVTPFGETGEADHLIMGRMMQTLYDNAIVVLQDNTGEINEELRVILCRLSLEELTRIWESLREPYRLSVCYQVKVSLIDSQQIASTARVIERRDAYSDSPEALQQTGRLS